MSKFVITSGTLEQLDAFLTQLDYRLDLLKVDSEDMTKARNILQDFKSDVVSQLEDLI